MHLRVPRGVGAEGRRLVSTNRTADGRVPAPQDVDTVSVPGRTASWTGRERVTNLEAMAHADSKRRVPLRVVLCLLTLMPVSCSKDSDSAQNGAAASASPTAKSTQSDKLSFIGQRLCAALKMVVDRESSASIKRVFGPKEAQGLVVGQKPEAFDSSSGQAVRLAVVIHSGSFERVGPRDAGNAGFRAYELRHLKSTELGMLAGVIGFTELLVPRRGTPVGLAFQDQADDHLLIRVTYRMPSGSDLALIQVSHPIPPLNGRPIKIRSHEGKMIGRTGYWVERGKSFAMHPFTRKGSREMRWIDTCSKSSS